MCLPRPAEHLRVHWRCSAAPDLRQVGKRACSHVHETELFRHFRAHYGCRVKFCNPYAGYEKGNVERKVGYVRANLFVPVPRVKDFHVYNRELLKRHDVKAQETHYKKGVSCAFRRRPCRTAIGCTDKNLDTYMAQKGVNNVFRRTENKGTACFP